MGEITNKDRGQFFGYHSADEKKIVIDSRLIPALQKEAVPHDLAHAIARGNPKGFNSDVQAFDNALNQFKITNPKAMGKSFKKITTNAIRTKAEAFSDMSRNGKNETTESILIMENWKK